MKILTKGASAKIGTHIGGNRHESHPVPGVVRLGSGASGVGGAVRLGEARVTFYGIARARREGWTLRRYPARPCALFHESDEELARFRRRGAVIVGVRLQAGTGNRQILGGPSREWWFGLPPPGVKVDLRKLAADAGMLGDPPETFAWKGAGA